MTARRYPRTMAEAFPRDSSWADPEIVRAVIDTRGMSDRDFRSTLQPEAASAVSDFCETYPTQPGALDVEPRRRSTTVSTWQRIKRALRRALINRRSPL